MEIRRAIRWAIASVEQELHENLYIRSRLDRTRPLAVRGLVTRRCNFHCRYCDFWRHHDHHDELTDREWRDALMSLRDFLGRYLIQFSGGEPFVRPGFTELLTFCRDQGIDWGVVTNGSMLDPDTARRIVAAQPANIDISVDGITETNHDRIRGFAGSLDRITTAISLLREERERIGHLFPVRIKATVHRLNFRHLMELVDWVEDVGATTVDFQAIRPWTAEVESELWIRQEHDLRELERVVAELVARRREGGPIETEDQRMQYWTDHFRGIAGKPSLAPCRVGLRDYHIQANGDVHMCWLYPPIGNVRRASARELWYGAEAKNQRLQMLTCSRFGSLDCASSCLNHRTFWQNVKRGLMIMRRRRA